LYQSLKLPMPDQPSKTPIPLLIYGGSTGTGILAIQYAKLSGCTVVTTSSPHNFDYLKSLGADATFDYNSPSVVEDIKAYTKGQLKHALDCISSESSMKITVGAFSGEGGVYTTLQPVPDDKVQKINSKVKTQMTLAYKAIGEGFKKFGAEMPGNPDDFEFAKEFWELTRQLLANGKLKVARTKINEGGAGLQGVLKGLDDLKNNRVSGAKLVYTL
jgi:NADPH:quinone reductase-like Zn-dependent oxidoreductase